jgi:hypothetical protein
MAVVFMMRLRLVQSCKNAANQLGRANDAPEQALVDEQEVGCAIKK